MRTLGHVLEVPQVAASYATHLQIRTHTEPEISVTGASAQVGASLADKTLTLVFGCNHEWSGVADARNLRR